MINPPQSCLCAVTEYSFLFRADFCLFTNLLGESLWNFLIDPLTRKCAHLDTTQAYDFVYTVRGLMDSRGHWYHVKNNCLETSTVSFLMTLIIFFFNVKNNNSVYLFHLKGKGHFWFYFLLPWCLLQNFIKKKHNDYLLNQCSGIIRE